MEGDKERNAISIFLFRRRGTRYLMFESVQGTSEEQLRTEETNRGWKVW